MEISERSRKFSSRRCSEPMLAWTARTEGFIGGSPLFHVKSNTRHRASLILSFFICKWAIELTFLFFKFINFGGRGRERDLLFHLFMHSLVILVCTLTQGDRTHSFGILWQHSNLLSYLARAWACLVFKQLLNAYSRTSGNEKTLPSCSVHSCQIQVIKTCKCIVGQLVVSCYGVK